MASGQYSKPLGHRASGLAGPDYTPTPRQEQSETTMRIKEGKIIFPWLLAYQLLVCTAQIGGGLLTLKRCRQEYGGGDGPPDDNRI